MADRARNIRAGAFLTPPESTYILPFSTIWQQSDGKIKVNSLPSHVCVAVSHWLTLAYLLHLGLPYFAIENECVCFYSFEEKEQEDMPNL